MKFHSDVKTVFISMLVLLLFVCSSIFIIAELNLTSPTLIVTKSIFQNISEKESVISLSFSSMERNFRDRVLVNDLSVSFRGEEIASFKSAEIRMGLFDLISYVLRGKAEPQIHVKDGNVNIPLSLFSSSHKEDKSGEVVLKEKEESPSILSRYKFSVTLENTVVNIGNSSSLKGISASFRWGGSISDVKGIVKIPSISFSDGALSGEIKDVEVSAFLSETLSISLSTGSGNATWKGADLTISSLSGKLSSPQLTSLSSLTGYLVSESMTAEYDSYQAEVKGVRVDVLNSLPSLSIPFASIKGKDIELALEKLALSMDEEKRISGSLNKAKGSAYGVAASLSSLTISEYSLKDNSLSLSVGEFSLPQTKALSKGLIEDITLSAINGKVKIGEETVVSLSLRSSLNPSNAALSSVEAGIGGGIKVKDGKIVDYGISFTDFYPGYGERRNNSISLIGGEKEAKLAFSYDTINISLSYDFVSSLIKGKLGASSYPVSDILPYLGEMGERYKGYFGDEAKISLDSSFSFSLDDEAKIRATGSLDYDLKLEEISILGGDTLHSSATLRGDKDALSFKDLSLSSSTVKIIFNGNLGYEKILPSFSLEVFSNDSLMADGDFSLGSDDFYTYSVEIGALKDSSLKGSFALKEVINGESVLKTKDILRPFTFSYDRNSKILSLESPKIKLDADLGKGIDVHLSLTNLDTIRDGLGNPMVADGSVYFSMPRGEKATFSTSGLKLTNMWFIPSSPDVSLAFSGDFSRIAVTDVSVSLDKVEYFKGKADFDIEKMSFTASLDEVKGEGDVVFSFFKGEVYSGLIRARSLDLSPFGVSDMYFNLNITGRASKLQDLSLDGKLEVLGFDSVNDDRKVTAGISLSGESLTLEDIRFTTSGIDLRIDSISWDTNSGKLEMGDGLFISKGEHADRDYPIKAAFGLNASMEDSESIYNSIFDLIKFGGEGLDLSLDLKYIDIDNSRIRVEDKSAFCSIRNRVMYISGSLAAGTFAVDDKKFDVSVDLMPLFSGRVYGTLGKKIEANAIIDAFNMYFVNIFMKAPYITFEENYVRGEAGVTAENGIYFLNGNLSADEMGVNIFWVPDQRIIIHNPRFTLWNNDLRSAVSKATVIDYTTYERKTIDIYAGLTLTPTLSMEGFVAEMWMDKENAVRLRLPLPMVNVDIKGNAYGHYYMKTTEGMPMDNNGEFFIEDAEVSIGMNPYPQWYQLKGNANFNLDLNFLRNNRIIYPAGQDPIISIVLDENSSIVAKKNRADISVTGDIDVRGGEIFYFQKYFYITEGNITFPDPTKIDPKINLRATLRDYDSDGNRVEIYLVMKDNTFGNISPTLESSPAKDLNEIMSILGQSILPSSTYGTVSVGSVASLVTEGIDILGRLGIVTTAANPISGMSESLKEVFGVDSFSIHSNIVNNILTDTLSSSFSDNYSTYSPMARYLNGTTLNIGKYLSSSFYLQGMVHLAASSNAKDKYTFISDDLVLDTEFSLEWMNPAFKITFITSPSYLSFYSILDTFRFSISKTLNW